MALLTAKIPSTGQPLPRLGLGTYRSFDQAPGTPAAVEAAAVLKAFYEHGGRLLDSSPMYGQAEALSGTLSTQLGINADLFMATKVWTQGAKEGRAQMEASMRLMGRQGLELMQVHNLLDFKSQWPLLKEWKAAGRFRYIGITHYSNGAFAELEAVLRAHPMDFLQIPYNLDRTDAAKRLIPAAEDLGVAVIANEPFGQGAVLRRLKGKPLPSWAAELGISSWPQLCLKFILGDARIQFVIPATGKLQHLLDFLPGGAGALPDESLRKKMEAL